MIQDIKDQVNALTSCKKLKALQDALLSTDKNIVFYRDTIRISDDGKELCFDGLEQGDDVFLCVVEFIHDNDGGYYSATLYGNDTDVHESAEIDDFLEQLTVDFYYEHTWNNGGTRTDDTDDTDDE